MMFFCIAPCFEMLDVVLCFALLGALIRKLELEEVQYCTVPLI